MQFRMNDRSGNAALVLAVLKSR